MPELKIQIPPEFVASMKKFMEQTQKYAELTNKIQEVQAQITQSLDLRQIAQLQNPLTKMVGLMRRMSPLFHKLESTLLRSSDRMMMMLGPRIRSLVRLTVMPEHLFSGLSAVTNLAGTMSAGRFALLFRMGGVPAAVITVVKWLYDKSIGLMEAAQQDRIQAIISGTTVGGLRAFRSVFWMLPSDPRFFNIISTIRAAQTSNEAIAVYGVLGVKRNQDTIDTMIQTLLAAQAFLRQFPGQELLAAEKFGLPQSPETTLALTERDPEQLRRRAAHLLQLRRRLELTSREQLNIQEFLFARQDLLDSIYVNFQRIMVNSGIVETITKLSKWMTEKIKAKDAEGKPPSVVRKKDPDATDPVKDFSLWASSEASGMLKDFTNRFDQLNNDLRRYIQKFKQASRYLDDIALVSPAAAARAYPGRAAFARRISGAEPRAEPALPAAAPRHPGRVAFAQRIGQGPPEVRAGPATRNDPRGLESYIRERAQAYGIDPDIAMRVARSEGLSSFYGDNNTSFGAFQLHVTPGGRGGAVGDNFRRDTGLDPSDPRNERAMIDYALRHAKRYGWGAWSGARNQGINGYRGINRTAPEPPQRAAQPPAQAPAAQPPPPQPLAPAPQPAPPAAAPPAQPSTPAIRQGQWPPAGAAPPPAAAPVQPVPAPRVQPPSERWYRWKWGPSGARTVPVPSTSATPRPSPAPVQPSTSATPRPTPAPPSQPLIPPSTSATPRPIPSVPGATSGYLLQDIPSQPGYAPLPQFSGMETAKRFSRADVNSAIDNAAANVRVDRNTMYAIADIESSGDPSPRSTTGRYKGLFQLDDHEFRKYGGGDIYNPADNANAAARKMKAESDILGQRLGRPLTPSELYLTHQQGYEGAYQHITNPDRPAWESMYATAEGQQRGQAWAKKAIWGNTLPEDKRRFGSVENITSAQFVDMWHRRYERGVGGRPGPTATAPTATTSTATAPTPAAPGTVTTALPEQMEGDIEGRGPSGARFNVPAGTSISPRSDHETIVLSNGQSFTVNKAVAPQFKGFYEDLIKAGAPVRNIGGFGSRGNPSQHPIGYATDWAQSSRDVVSPDVARWIRQNPDTLNALERRWGMSGAEHWRNPDTGHFSINRVYGPAHLEAAQRESAGRVSAEFGGPPHWFRRAEPKLPSQYLSTKSFTHQTGEPKAEPTFARTSKIEQPSLKRTDPNVHSSLLDPTLTERQKVKIDNRSSKDIVDDAPRRHRPLIHHDNVSGDGASVPGAGTAL